MLGTLNIYHRRFSKIRVSNSNFSNWSQRHDGVNFHIQKEFLKNFHKYLSYTWEAEYLPSSIFEITGFKF